MISKAKTVRAYTFSFRNCVTLKSKLTRDCGSKCYLHPSHIWRSNVWFVCVLACSSYQMKTPLFVMQNNGAKFLAHSLQCIRVFTNHSLHGGTSSKEKFFIASVYLSILIAASGFHLPNEWMKKTTVFTLCFGFLHINISILLSLTATNLISGVTKVKLPPE